MNSSLSKTDCNPSLWKPDSLHCSREAAQEETEREATSLSLEGREEECRGRESTQLRARRGATEIWRLVLYYGNWQGGEQKLLSSMLL
jgi:hypothetical protein